MDGALAGVRRSGQVAAASVLSEVKCLRWLTQRVPTGFHLAHGPIAFQSTFEVSFCDPFATHNDLDRLKPPKDRGGLTGRNPRNTGISARYTVCQVRLGKPTLYQLSYVRAPPHSRAGRRAPGTTLGPMPGVMRILVAVALVLILASPSIAAAAPAPKTTLNDIEDEVMCPVCGTPLNLATDAPSANDERALIRRLIAQGYSKQQIKRRLAQELGPRVLALPSQKGFNVAAYLVPIVLGLGGLVAIAVLAIRWRRRRPPTAADDRGGAEPSLDPTDARRLSEDLARYDS